MERLFEKYIDKIMNLSKSRITKEDILNSLFLLEENNNMKIFYVPHNEYVNKKAQVVIVGICPGWTQTELAYNRAKKDLENNIDYSEILKNCKEIARFAGSMRKNLVDMLDELDLPQKLGINSSIDLFGNNDILHTTSLIPYLVFIEGKNYTGHTPKIIDSEFLMKYVENHFYNEIKIMTKHPLIIPLGKSVEDVLKLMIEKHIILESQCLFGFPHPSGANGHRKVQFNQNKNNLISKVNEYFTNNK